MRIKVPLRYNLLDFKFSNPGNITSVNSASNLSTHAEEKTGKKMWGLGGQQTTGEASSAAVS